MVLVSQFRLQQRGLRGFKVGQDHRYGVVPPGQAAQVVLAHGKAAAYQMHARQHLAHLGAVRCARRKLAGTGEKVDDGCGFAAQGMQYFTLRVSRRVGHCDAVGGQVRHQAQVVRELLGRQSLKQGKHVARLRGVGKVIGVFNAAGAAFQACQRPQAQAFEQGAGLGE